MKDAGIPVHMCHPSLQHLIAQPNMNPAGREQSNIRDPTERIAWLASMQQEAEHQARLGHAAKRLRPNSEVHSEISDMEFDAAPKGLSLIHI